MVLFGTKLDNNSTYSDSLKIREESNLASIWLQRRQKIAFEGRLCFFNYHQIFLDIRIHSIFYLADCQFKNILFSKRKKIKRPIFNWSFSSANFFTFHFYGTENMKELVFNAL